jgi:hypothetical protein
MCEEKVHTNEEVGKISGIFSTTLDSVACLQGETKFERGLSLI